MAAIAMAAALLAAGCGTETGPTDTATAATESDTSSSNAPADDTVDDAAMEESGDAMGADDGTETEPEAEAAGPEPVGPHEFPDLGTVNIVDGGAVNLADQLAGGDTPVLLWFFAPH